MMSMLAASMAMAAASGQAPNVILIVADDHGYADRSILGIHQEVKTPNLDRLAREGTSCEEFYVTAPVCNPSRCGLLTGQYQERWGSYWFGNTKLADGVPTLAEKMREQGYATGFIGKAHYGTTDKPEGRGFPPNHGYDEAFFSLCGGRVHYLHHSKKAVEEYGKAASQMAVEPLWHNREQADFEGFTTWEFGKRARDFIETNKAKPFYLHLAFNAVHNFAWQLPPEELKKRRLPNRNDWMPSEGPYLDWYDNAIMPNLERGREYYLAQLELMDEEIGRLLDYLDKTGLAENTIIVYMSDNGGSTCNFADNTPLRGTKYTLYEGGIRVPLIVRWPKGGVPNGQTRKGMVSSMDLMPTLLKAVKAPKSAYAQCDGKDMLPFLKGRSKSSTHKALCWDCGFQIAVRDGDWKLYKITNEQQLRYVTDTEHASPAHGTELYNLKDDPGEKVNLAEAHPEIVSKLLKKFDAWKAGLSK